MFNSARRRRFHSHTYISSKLRHNRIEIQVRNKAKYAEDDKHFQSKLRIGMELR